MANLAYTLWSSASSVISRDLSRTLAALACKPATPFAAARLPTASSPAGDTIHAEDLLPWTALFAYWLFGSINGRLLLSDFVFVRLPLCCICEFGRIRLSCLWPLIFTIYGSDSRW